LLIMLNVGPVDGAAVLMGQVCHAFSQHSKGGSGILIRFILSLPQG